MKKRILQWIKRKILILSNFFDSRIEDKVLLQLTINAAVPLLKPDFELWLGNIYKNDQVPFLANPQISLPQLIWHYTHSHASQGPAQLQNDLLKAKEVFARQNLKKRSTVIQNDKMKILYISGMLPSPLHGGGLRLLDILSHLSKEHTVDLISVCTSIERQKGLCQDVEKIVNNCIFLNQVDFERLTLQSIEMFLGQKISEYDVVQLEYPNSIRIISEIKSHARKIGFTYMECVTRRILIDLNLETCFSLRKIASLFFELLRISTLERLAANECDFLIAMTEEDSKFINNTFGVQPEIVPTGISESQFCEISAKSQLQAPYRNLVVKNRVVFLGNYDHYPNVDGMLWYLKNIHPLVKAQIPDYKIHIVGAGNSSPFVDFSRNDESVKIIGSVLNPINNILESDVCIAPLISGAGIRGKVNQYTYLCRPTVSTKIAASGLPYQHGQDMYITDDPVEFSRHIVTLLTNLEKWNEMQSRARIICTGEFLWPPIITKLISLYRNS